MGWLRTRKLGLLLSVAPCRHGERKGGLNWKWGLLKVWSTNPPSPLTSEHYSWEEWGEGGWLVSPGRVLITPAGVPLTDFQDAPCAILSPVLTWPHGAVSPRPLIHKKKSGLACSDDLLCWMDRCPTPLSQALCLGALTTEVGKALKFSSALTVSQPGRAA